jgi:hypothetical protein
MALNKLEIPTTDPETNSRSPKLGTRWVAPGEGSTWRALVLVFGKPHPRMIDWRTNRIYQDWRLDKSTNLLLTGLPLQEADRERWESGSVR